MNADGGNSVSSGAARNASVSGLAGVSSSTILATAFSAAATASS